MVRVGRQFHLLVIAVLLVGAAVFLLSGWSGVDGVGTVHDYLDGPGYYDAEEEVDDAAQATPKKNWQQVVLDGLAATVGRPGAAGAKATSSAVSHAHTQAAMPESAIRSIVPLIPFPDPGQITPRYDRIIVMGKLERENTEWVRQKLPDWEHAVYKVDNPSSGHMHTLMNKGREAMPYLTFLVEHYDNLPSYIVFLHADQKDVFKAWHNEGRDRDIVYMLRTLNMKTVQRVGYANLRCKTNPGCPNRIQPQRGNSTVERAMAGAYRELLGRRKVPELLAAPCCSQFAVSREQVLKRPLADYKNYLDWLIRTPLDDDAARGVFEYLWHVIFGQDDVHCPDTKQCYCDLYGQCSSPAEFSSVSDGD